jgi:hypothetical protein
MAADGMILQRAFPYLPGAFAELNPQDFPITTIAAARGFVAKPQKDYTMTFHTNPTITSGNTKPDNASVTLGSTGFTSGSNTMNIFFEGASVTYARMGDQDLSRTLGWQGETNPSFSPNPMQRGLADAVYRIKGYAEYLSLYGTYNSPSEGTTGHHTQRGLLNDSQLTVGTAAGAVFGSGTVGTVGTLTRNKVFDFLSVIHGNKLWDSGKPLIVSGGAASFLALNYMFMDEFNMGKNGENINVSGINLTAFKTPLGDVYLNLTRNPANSQHLWFLNPAYLEMVVRPVPGKGFMFEKDTSTNDKAQESKGIYAEMGLNYMTGLAHGVMKGVGTSIVGGLAVA